MFLSLIPKLFATSNLLLDIFIMTSFGSFITIALQENGTNAHKPTFEHERIPYPFLGENYVWVLKAKENG